MHHRRFSFLAHALTFCLSFAAAASVWLGPPLAWARMVFREAFPDPRPAPEIRALLPSARLESWGGLFRLREYQGRALARMNLSHRRAPPLQLAAA